MSKRGKLILTSKGLTTETGYRLIKKELEKDKRLSEKTIYLFFAEYYLIEALLIKACLGLGFRVENIYLSGPDISKEVIRNADYIYCTEGNTFEVLNCMQKADVMEEIREAVLNGATYIGASAGAMIAGQDIGLAADFDRNFVGLDNVKGLQLFDGTIIPHYTAAERKRYIANSDPDVIARYNHIYSVSNYRKLVIE